MSFLGCWTVSSFAVIMVIKVISINVKSHLKVKVIPESNFNSFDFYHEVGGGPLTECTLFLCIDSDNRLNKIHIHTGLHYELLGMYMYVWFKRIKDYGKAPEVSKNTHFHAGCCFFLFCGF